MVKTKKENIPATLIIDHTLTYDTKDKVLLNEYGVQNVNSLNGFGVFPDQLKSYSTQNFQEKLKIEIISVADLHKADSEEVDLIQLKNGKNIQIENRKALDIEFDIIGAEAALVNSFRRILLAEVPTVAFEKCYLYQNTSIVQDEILTHRLGLIPLKIDPRKLNYRPGDLPGVNESPNLIDLDDRIFDTIRFQLHVKSHWKDGKKPDLFKNNSAKAKIGGTKLLKDVQKHNNNPANKNNIITDKDLFEHSHVYSGDLEWVPLNEAQRQFFKDCPPRPVHDDILLARLRPDQEIKLVVDAVKGIGADHAKFSPVVGLAGVMLFQITYFLKNRLTVGV